MSEFQYYEFYAIDKELTRQEREQVDKLSSRFSPTSRRAIFTYSYSDFRHNEESVLLKYFDFFLYLSNWGTKRVMYKFPQEIVNYDEIKQYKSSFENEYVDNGILIYKKSKFVIVDINLSKEEGDFWVEEENNWSADLMGLRQNILDGDYRALFIIWLHIKNLEYDYETIDLDTKISKQLIPDNLNQLNSNLNRLIEFYEVNKDWITGAAKYSAKSSTKSKNYNQQIKNLPVDKKDEYLLRILEGELNLNIKLKKELDKIGGKQQKQSTEKITLRQLLNSINDAEDKRRQIEKKEEEVRQLNRLKDIEKNKSAILKEIKHHVERGTGKSYDEALERIIRLRDLAKHKNEELKFNRWINKLKKEIMKKPAMIRRIENQGL